MSKFNVGDRVVIKKYPGIWASLLNCNCPSNIFYPLETVIDRIMEDGVYTAMSAGGYGFFLSALIDQCAIELIEAANDEIDLGSLNYYPGGVQNVFIKESKTKTIMNKVTEFVKNLALSADEKSLRSNGFKDDCGNYTEIAKEFAINNLCKDQEAKMIDISTVMDVAAAKNK